MEKFTLNLTVNEGNLILEGLGAMPYTKSAHLISKISKTADEQLIKKKEKVEKEVEKEITEKEMEAIR